MNTNELKTKFLESLALTQELYDLVVSDCSKREFDELRLPASLVKYLERKPAKPKDERVLNAGKPWTEEDYEMVRSLMSDGKTANEIAVEMKRIRGSITSVLVRLGLVVVDGLGNYVAVKDPPKQSNCPVWTNRTVNYLMAMFTNNIDTAEMALKLHMSEDLVIDKLVELELVDVEEDAN